MRKNPEFEELFDDDFEVTYEEYVPNEYRSSNDIYNDYDDDDDYYDDDYYDDDYEDEYYESVRCMLGNVRQSMWKKFFFFLQ